VDGLSLVLSPPQELNPSPSAHRCPELALLF
jgi:hypothetical protein